MKNVIYVLPLPDWTINGVTYYAPEKHIIRAPSETDGHYRLEVGKESRLPDKGGVEEAKRMHARNSSSSSPMLQRFKLRIVEEPDENDELASLVAALGVERDPATVERDAVAKRAAAIEAENAKLRESLASLRAAVDRGDSLIREEANKRAEAEAVVASLKAALEKAQAALDAKPAAPADDKPDDKASKASHKHGK